MLLLPQASTGDGDRPAARRLDQEPLLAARIMIEDCMGLLMDVDDIDRLLAARHAQQQLQPPGPAQEAAAARLRERRVLLLAGITNSFCLPMTPEGGATTAGAPAGDGVFLRITALSKGRRLIARALMAIAPPAAAAAAPAAAAAGQQAGAGSGAAELTPASAVAAAVADTACQLLWATLRNAWALFGAQGNVQAGDAAAEKAMSEATSCLAAAAREALSKLPTGAAVVAAAAAFAAGCEQHCAGLRQPAGPMDGKMLPLAQTRVVHGAPGAPAPEWLGDVLTALLRRAQHFGLNTPSPHRPEAQPNGAAADEAEAEAGWAKVFPELYERVVVHLGALQVGGRAAAQGAGTGRGGRDGGRERGRRAGQG